MEHILVIDDEIEACDILREVLNKEGYVVQAATTELEALKRIKQRQPELIICDIFLGETDGVNLLKKFKQMKLEVPVMMVSAYGMQDKVIEALELGADDFIAKPFIPNNIVSAVKRVLELSKLTPVEKDKRMMSELSPMRRLLRNSYISILKSLAIVVESKDPYLQEHSLRVTRYAVLLARELGLNEEEIDIIEQTGRFHDIGKIGISDTILQKKGELDADEWEQIKAHPVIGYKIVEPLKLLHIALPGIRHHHERYDGQGYPDRLKGEDIPKSARIMAIADAYEAITADRPYRRGRRPQEAAAELQRNAGTQFDPEFVEAFVRVLKETGEI